MTQTNAVGISSFSLIGGVVAALMIALAAPACSLADKLGIDRLENSAVTPTEGGGGGSSGDPSAGYSGIASGSSGTLDKMLMQGSVVVDLVSVLLGILLAVLGFLALVTILAMIFLVVRDKDRHPPHDRE